MQEQLQNAANTLAALTPNPELQEVVNEYLRFKYKSHIRSHSIKGYFVNRFGLGCGCDLCQAVSAVTFWTRVVLLLDHHSWRGGWKSAGPAYVNAMKNLQEAKRTRDELRGKVSSYL